jgi:hypothetical protein
VTTNIVETLPWIDYGEVFRALEERAGVEEGWIDAWFDGYFEGRNTLGTEFAFKVLVSKTLGADISATIQILREVGISDKCIEAARRQMESQS